RSLAASVRGLDRGPTGDRVARGPPSRNSGGADAAGGGGLRADPRRNRAPEGGRGAAPGIRVGEPRDGRGGAAETTGAYAALAFVSVGVSLAQSAGDHRTEASRSP